MHYTVRHSRIYADVSRAIPNEAEAPTDHATFE
jgi:hypothetical protein